MSGITRIILFKIAPAGSENYFIQSRLDEKDNDFFLRGSENNLLPWKCVPLTRSNYPVSGLQSGCRESNPVPPATRQGGGAAVAILVNLGYLLTFSLSCQSIQIK